MVKPELTIHLCNDDVTIPWRRPALNDQQVTRQDAGLVHRVPVHFEQVRCFLIADQQLIERDRIRQLFFSRA
jgi:hypothetical protein